MAEYKGLGPLLAPEGDFLTGNGYYPGTSGMVWDVDGIPWLLDPTDVARLADAEGDMYSMAASINDLFFWGESYDDVRQDIIAKIRTTRLKNKLYQTDYAAKNQVDPLDHIRPGREHYKEYIARQKEKVQYTTDVASAAVPLAKGALKLVRTPPKLPFGTSGNPCPLPASKPLAGPTPKSVVPTRSGWRTAADAADELADAPFAPGSVGAAKAWTSIKSRLKAAQLPTSGRIRFVPPNNYNPASPLTRGPSGGYIDPFGNEWVRGPSRTAGEAFEWDVQLSTRGKETLGWLSREGDHVNVSLGGHVTH